MAGNKQHHLPRFLQSGFASKSSGKELATWVFKSNSEPYKSNISDSGAARKFYTNGDDRTLDDRITSLESSLATLVQELRAGPLGIVHSPGLPILVAHLEARSSVFRAMFQDTASDLLSKLDVKSLKEVLLSRAKADARKILRTPGSISRYASEHGYESPDAQKLDQIRTLDLDSESVRLAMESRFEEAMDLLTSLLSPATIREYVKQGHISALLNDLVPERKRERYSKLGFSVHRVDSADMILGDSGIVFFVDSERSVSPFLDEGDPLLAVALPISSNRILLGGEGEVAFTSARLQEAVAEYSYSFFIGASNSPENRAMAARIGSRATLLNQDQIRVIAAESVEETKLRLEREVQNDRRDGGD